MGDNLNQQSKKNNDDSDTDNFLTEQFQDQSNLNKLVESGKVTSKVLDLLIKQIKPGASIYELCKIGDELIHSELENRYKSGLKYGKGVCFPTCISRNNMAGYFSPVLEEDQRIEEGDLIKIELGVHLNGFPATVAYTMVINTSEEKISDKRARVVNAVAEASRNVLPILKVGYSNVDVVKVLEKSAEKYGCNLLMSNGYIDHVPGVFSYQMSQNVIDGHNDDNDIDYVHKLILSKHNPDFGFTLRKTEFEENELYAIDITMSTGKGKIDKRDTTTTIYKRKEDASPLSLRLKSAQEALKIASESKYFPRSIKDKFNVRFKFGIKQCLENDLIEDYPVLYEKDGEYIAQIKFTVMIGEKKTRLITGRSANEALEKVTLETTEKKDNSQEVKNN